MKQTTTVCGTLPVLGDDMYVSLPHNLYPFFRKPNSETLTNLLKAPEKVSEPACGSNFQDPVYVLCTALNAGCLVRPGT